MIHINMTITAKTTKAIAYSTKQLNTTSHGNTQAMKQHHRTYEMGEPLEQAGHVPPDGLSLTVAGEFDVHTQDACIAGRGGTGGDKNVADGGPPDTGELPAPGTDHETLAAGHVADAAIKVTAEMGMLLQASTSDVKLREDVLIVEYDDADNAMDTIWMVNVSKKLAVRP